MAEPPLLGLPAAPSPADALLAGHGLLSALGGDGAAASILTVARRTRLKRDWWKDEGE